MKDTKAKGIIVVVALLLAAVVTLGLASPAGAVGGYRVSWTGSDGLNVRSGPDVTFSKVATIKTGTIVTIYETAANGWLRIGDKRWVSGKFVKV